MISKQVQEFWSLLKARLNESSCRLLRGARPANTQKMQLRKPLESTAYGSHISQNPGDTLFWAGSPKNTQIRVFSMAEGSNQYSSRDYRDR